MILAEIAGEALFRANPRYTLTPLDRLDPSQLSNAQAYGLDSSAYGVFLPAAGSPLHVRSACADSALLVLSLQSPARIPQYLRRQNPAGWIEEVKKLLLDEVLEVRVGDAYLSGTALLVENALLADTPPEGGDLLSSLSTRALLHAEKVDILDPSILAGRLYCFNRRPFCPDSHGGLVGPGRVAAFLGLDELEKEASFRRHWRRQPSSPAFSGWQNFFPLEPGKRTRVEGRWTCKLYISAQWSHMPGILHRFLSNPRSHECATGFKVPCDVFGLLRPDNFVVYLRSKEALRELADSLASSLQGIPVQGVPFSSPLSRDGLLSWGADPPRGSDYGRAGESWRSWLANQLAANIVQAKGNAAGVPPRALALERLRLGDRLRKARAGGFLRVSGGRRAAEPGCAEDVRPRRHDLPFHTATGSSHRDYAGRVP